MEERVHIIRQGPLRRLERALDEMVAEEARLEKGRDAMLRPLRTLDQLALYSVDALHNRLGAVEAFKQVLAGSLSDSWAIFRALSVPDGAPSGGDARTQPSTPTGAEPSRQKRPCEPSLIEMGPLVGVMIAAARVGAWVGRATRYVEHTETLAMTALPADQMTRAWIAAGGSASVRAQLRSVLLGLSDGDNDHSLLKEVAGSFMDRCSSALASCVSGVGGELRRRLRELDDDIEWDGGRSEVIEAVRPVGAAHPRRLEVTLNDGFEAALGLADGSTDPKPVKRKRGSRRDAVEKWSISTVSPHETLKVEVVPGKSLGWVADVPETAGPGYLVLSTDQLLAKVDATHERLATGWSEARLGACLHGSEIPVWRSKERPVWPIAQPAEEARWGTQLLDVTIAPTDAGRVAHVSVERAWPDTSVRIYGGDEVLAEEKLPPGRRDLEIDIPAGVVASEVRVLTHGRVLDREMIEEVEPLPPPPGPDSMSHFVTIVRPALVEVGRRTIERVPRSAERRVLGALSSVLGANVKPLPMPWLDDTDLVVSDELLDSTDPAALDLIEGLEHVGATTSGRYNSLILGLLPPGRGYRVVPSSVAGAIAISDVSSLPAAMREVERMLMQRGARWRDCLRITGYLGERLAIEGPVRREKRLLPPPEGVVTEVVALTKGSDGRSISEERLHMVRPTRRGRFAMFVPITDDVRAVNFLWRPELLAVELRAVPGPVEARLTKTSGAVSYRAVGRLPSRSPRPPGGYLPSLYRPAGEPQVELTYWGPDGVQWSYRHTGGALATFEVEVGIEGVWRRVAVAPEGSGGIALELERLSPGLAFEAIRVVASDGWTSVADEKPIGESKASAWKGRKAVIGEKVVIRRASKDRYWLEGAPEDEGPVYWAVEGADHQKLSPLEPARFKAEKFSGRSIEARIGELTASRRIPRPR